MQERTRDAYVDRVRRGDPTDPIHKAKQKVNLPSKGRPTSYEVWCAFSKAEFGSVMKNFVDGVDQYENPPPQPVQTPTATTTPETTPPNSRSSVNNSSANGRPAALVGLSFLPGHGLLAPPNPLCVQRDPPDADLHLRRSYDSRNRPLGERGRETSGAKHHQVDPVTCKLPFRESK